MFAITRVLSHAPTQLPATSRPPVARFTATSAATSQASKVKFSLGTNTSSIMVLVMRGGVNCSSARPKVARMSTAAKGLYGLR